jgi:putative sigma-54 modulation protein
MKFIISGKNIEVTQGLREAIEEKIGKLEKYFKPETEVHVTLSVEKERQKIEVTIPVKGNNIRSEQVSSDMYVSIDLVEEIIERQLKKYKNKLVDQKQHAASAFKQDFIEKEYMDEEEVQIIRTKRFDVKPMYPEDACVQMELLGHNFFIFCNAETDQVNVVYKRKGNTYGLIEPELYGAKRFSCYLCTVVL